MAKDVSPAYRLRQSVVLQAPTTPTDGETTPTYSDVGKFRAEVVMTRGNERSRRDQIEAGIVWRVTFRYSGAIGADYRFRYGSRYLNILFSHEAADVTLRTRRRGRVVICDCEEVPA